MHFVDNENHTDPRLNLAIEEHLLRNLDMPDPILLFYINEPSVIIGRNQNSIEEIDPVYVKTQGIHVVRRLSGGGAVYHDLGNLNFSFITPDNKHLHNFAKFTEPVINVLNEFGVAAELRGRSDIFTGGKKISGNAQYASSGRMFSHGTLLFDTDIAEMLKALNPRQATIESKAVQSVRNFVTNIRELLVEEMDIHGLKQALLAGIFGSGEIPTYRLTAADWQQIDQIAAERYQLWDWNFGRSPNFNVQKSEHTPDGKLDVRLEVVKGFIQALKFYGDFEGKREVAELEKCLIGLRYDPDDLAAALADVDIQPYFGRLKKSTLLTLLY